MDDSLSFSTLFSGAQRFAQSAMDSHSEEKDEFFLLHAGVSIERLAKAVLVNKSPFLLMEMKGKDDTLYHLTGVRPAAKLRTIGAFQAISRLRDMGILAPRDSDLDELIELRNGVAHLNASVGESFDALGVFCRVTNSMLTHLDLSPDRYWGSWSTLVTITLSDLSKKTERDVARRLEQARRRLTNRFRGLPSVALESYIATRPNLKYGLQVTEDSVAVFLPWKCPACGNGALLVAGPPNFVWQDAPAESRPSSFICFVCQFTLKDEEMEAGGIPAHVPLADETGSRYLTRVEEVLWQQEPPGSELMDDFPNP
ncbi:hypothetical protein OG311_13610 [Streptomyces sp. NBC_01343]|uniref:hypothetical protein n=1 Tax=Streptomyces sp. NBC_01343 TaxID=2903832 RepID=UPI002E140942|nr:hypothetical protein OG311_13610 [Streptomyces sp. NBC_01343]